jgi:hypothetical protein
MAELTQERLKELLHYDPETGLFTWVGRAYRSVRLGRVAGNINKVSGYVQIRVDGHPCYGHRLVFLYMTGRLPENSVDHINGNRSDNRWKNLRDATNQENAQNQRRAKSGTRSGVMGACKDATRDKFNAKTIYLGRYDTAEEANAAYLDAKRAMHVGCTI